MGDSDRKESRDGDAADNQSGSAGVPGGDMPDNSAGHGIARPNPPTYRVLVAVASDKSGKTWKPGDIVTAADFPKTIIANWLKIGVLEALDGSQSK